MNASREAASGVRNRTRLVALAFVLVSVAAVHWRVLTAEFFEDDFVYLFRTRAIGVMRFMLEPWGGHFAPLGKLPYVCLVQLHPLRSTFGFALMFAMHLACAALVFALLLELTGRLLLAVSLSIVFGTAPVHAATLQWLANFAQLFLTAQVLLALHVASKLVREEVVRARDTWSCAGLLALGTMTFGIGYATSVVIPLMIWVLRPQLFRAPSVFVPFGLAALAGPAVYGAFGFDSTHELSPRALRLAGIMLADGVSMLVGRFGRGVGFRSVVSTPFGELSIPGIAKLSPWLLGVFVVGVTWAVIRSQVPVRRRIVAFSLLPIGIYGVIALGRAGAMVDFQSLALQSRYHYASLVGLVVLAGVAIDAVVPAPVIPPARAFVFVGAFALALVVLGAHVATRVTDPLAAVGRRTTMRAAERGLRAAMNQSARAGAAVIIRNQEFSPVAPLRLLGIGMADFPGLAGFFLLMHPDGRLDGRAVRFLERDADAVRILRNQEPAVRDLLLSEEEARSMGVAVVDADVRPNGD
jgi:hypothetical protein